MRPARGRHRVEVQLIAASDRCGGTRRGSERYGDLGGARLQMWILAAFDRYDEYDVADSTLDSFASRLRDSLRKFTRRY